jgi:hypothetical protein
MRAADGTWIIEVRSPMEAAALKLPALFEVSHDEVVELLQWLNLEESSRELTSGLRSRSSSPAAAVDRSENSLKKTEPERIDVPTQNQVEEEADNTDRGLKRDLEVPSRASATIGCDDSTYSIKIFDKTIFLHKEHHNTLASLVARKIANGTPEGIVPWRDANSELYQKEGYEYVKNHIISETGATYRVREALSELNKLIRDQLGDPPQSDKWLLTYKRKGFGLNPSVTWFISEELKKRLKSRGRRTVTRKQKDLEKYQPNPGDRIPAQRVPRMRKRGDEAEDDDWR